MGRKYVVWLFVMDTTNIKSRYLGDLNETFRFTIPDTTLTLFLTPYGDRLAQEDIVACLQDAGSFIIRQITLRGNRQMPRRTWRVNNAALEALPGPYMSLAMGLEVVGALEDIVIERDWTFATQVLVVDIRFGGIGSLRIAYWWTPNAGTEGHRTGRRNLWEGKRKNLEA